MNKFQRKLTILGSTGSIGRQTLEVIDSLNSHFDINFLTVNSNIELLEKQIEKYSPNGVVIANENAYKEFKNSTNFSGEILKGTEGVLEAASSENDLVVSALVGFSGVYPTLAAIRSGSDVALANKETLVSAGSVITREARENNVEIIAVDSEHSAILQCLAGESKEEIDKLILTASGGPFRNVAKEEFGKITVKDALNHPNWSMGSKVTIDSATMMNKGLEVIEAYWLFRVDIKNIEVVVHPQSIIHSMVEFIDGSVKAQLGLPDMRVPISYALNFPKRFYYDFPRLNLSEIGTLSFESPDTEKFKCLKLAYEVIDEGGTAPAVLNASNEVAVHAFLNQKLNFSDIPDVIEKVLNSCETINEPEIGEILSLDGFAREKAEEVIY